MIVIDASALLEFLLTTTRGQAVARRIEDEAETLHAPHLIDLEVAQVLRRLCGAGSLSTDRACEAFTDLLDLDLHRYPHDALLPRMWELRDNATAYDASYLALAEGLGANLVTCDAALASVPGVEARVDVIA